MTERIFVRVVGFSDEERHALNTLFRLAQQEGMAFAPWTPGAPGSPVLALIDGDSYQARIEIEMPSFDRHLKLIWIGHPAPANAVRAFQRPLDWPRILKAMKSVVGVPDGAAGELDVDLEHSPDTESDELDLDLGFDGWAPDTQPPEAPQPTRAVLVVVADVQERLYLRARFSLAKLTSMEEASTAAEGLGLLQTHPYHLVLVDLDLPHMSGWELLNQIKSLPSAVPHVWTSTRQATWWTRMQARRAGAEVCLARPYKPAQLFRLIRAL